MSRFNQYFETKLETRARIMARNKNIRIILRGNVPCTDGTTIFLPILEDITDELMEDYDGFVDHETAHCKYTDFEVLPKLINRFHKEFLNALEDSRIELRLRIDWPGTRYSLDRLNKKWGTKMNETRFKKDVNGFYVMPWPVRVIACLREIYDGKAPQIDEQIEPLILPVVNDVIATRDMNTTGELIDATLEIIRKINTIRESLFEGDFPMDDEEIAQAMMQIGSETPIGLDPDRKDKKSREAVGEETLDPAVEKTQGGEGDDSETDEDSEKSESESESKEKGEGAKSEDSEEADSDGEGADGDESEDSESEASAEGDSESDSPVGDEMDADGESGSDSASGDEEGEEPETDSQGSTDGDEGENEGDWQDEESDASDSKGESDNKNESSEAEGSASDDESFSQSEDDSTEMEQGEPSGEAGSSESTPSKKSEESDEAESGELEEDADETDELESGETDEDSELDSDQISEGQLEARERAAKSLEKSESTKNRAGLERNVNRIDPELIKRARENAKNFRESEIEKQMLEDKDGEKSEFDNHVFSSESYVEMQVEKAIEMDVKPQRYEGMYDRKADRIDDRMVSLPFTTEFDEVIDYTGKGDPHEYASRKRKVMPLVRPIMTKFERVLKVKENAKVVFERERGVLNKTALARVATDKTYRFPFKEMIRTETKDVAVSLFIDCSGSMEYDKIELARQTGLALGEALNGIDIPFEICGFNTDGSYEMRAASSVLSMEERKRFNRLGTKLRLMVFKDFASRDLSGICLAEAGGANADGESIIWAAKRLALRQEKRKILIVLSDGQPACEGDGMVLAGDLKRVIKMLPKAGIEPIGIGILTDSPKLFYPNNVLVDKLEDLPTTVMSKLTKMLLDGIK